jgi:Transposase, Mutator family
MVSPDSLGTACPLSGRNSTYRPVQIPEAGSLRALRLTKAAELAEGAVEETLTYYQFPEQHWRRIRTNNPLERILREIRRRTRVVAWSGRFQTAPYSTGKCGKEKLESRHYR